MSKIVAVMCVVLLLLVSSTAYAAGRIVKTDKAPAAIGPYSQAVWAGNILYLSGQIGLVPETNKMIEGGTLKEAEQIFKNVAAVLESQGMGFKDIVKATVFALDIKEFPDVNKLYATFFPENPPARSFVQAVALPAGAAIEIEFIAYKDTKRTVTTDKAPAAIGPYSQAVWAGNMLFLSGQIGLVPETNKMIEGGTLKEAEQIFKNVAAILESQGMSFKDIVKATVFGMDIKEFPEVNKLYATFFPENPPARSFVQAAALPAGALIEIEFIAYRE